MRGGKVDGGSGKRWGGKMGRGGDVGGWVEKVRGVKINGGGEGREDAWKS